VRFNLKPPLADGTLTRKERTRLHNERDRASRHTCRQTHDVQRQPGAKWAAGPRQTGFVACCSGRLSVFREKGRGQGGKGWDRFGALRLPAHAARMAQVDGPHPDPRAPAMSVVTSSPT